MPRKARADAQCELNHMIAGGNGRRKIFDDNDDRDFLSNALGKLSPKHKPMQYHYEI